jgi:hypothetical protein
LQVLEVLVEEVLEVDRQLEPQVLRAPLIQAVVVAVVRVRLVEAGVLV